MPAGRPCHLMAMVHLIKLSVGVRDLDHLREVQAARAAVAPLRHITRSFPRRAEEIVAEGSIHWVVAGLLLARQRVVDIVQARREDGTPCTALMLDPVLVAVVPRPVRPFQGWRYLEAEAAPADLDAASGAGHEMPPRLRAELMVLGLL